MRGLIISLVLFFSAPSFAALSDEVRAELADLIIITEDYPPLSYLDNGELKGFSSELLMLVYQQLDIPLPEVQVLPWTRGYRQALSDKPVLLFSTARTPTREALFQWAGPLYRSQVLLVTWQGSGIEEYDPDLQQNEKVLAVRADISRTVLDEHGYPAGMISEADSSTQQYRLFAKKRVKLASVSKAPFFAALATANEPDLEPVTLHTMRETTGYFALSHAVSAGAVAAIQQALNVIVADHQALLKQYHLDL